VSLQQRSAWPIRSARSPGLQSGITTLDKDPLKDITSVRRVVSVMKGGIVYKNAARGAIPVYAGVPS